MRLSLQEALGLGDAFGEGAATGDGVVQLEEVAKVGRVDVDGGAELGAKVAVRCGECLDLLRRLHLARVRILFCISVTISRHKQRMYLQKGLLLSAALLMCCCAIWR